MDGDSSEVRSPFGNQKTSDFLRIKLRCFASKVRRFASKKSDVLHFRSQLFKKKFCVFLLHFLHQSLKTPLYIGDFRWRIGCRIQAGCRIYPAFSVLFILFSHLFVPPYPAFSCDSVPDLTWNCWISERFPCGSSAEHSRWVLLYWRLLLWTNKVLCGRLYLTISYTISCKTGRKVSQKGAIGVG